MEAQQQVPMIEVAKAFGRLEARRWDGVKRPNEWNGLDLECGTHHVRFSREDSEQSAVEIYVFKSDRSKMLVRQAVVDSTSATTIAALAAALLGEVAPRMGR